MTTKTDQELAREWAKRQEGKFMVVRAVYGDWTDISDEHGEFVGTLSATPDNQPIELLSDMGLGLDRGPFSQKELDAMTREYSTGWRARLTAPGYMDCTDWTTTREAEEAAIVELWELYGQDNDEGGG